MKLQPLALSVALLAVITASSFVAVPSVRGQGDTSVSTSLTGSLPLIGPYSFDLCQTVLVIISCSVSFVVAEGYKQNVTLQVQESPNELQVGSTENTGVTLITELPVQVLDFNFTYDGNVYSYTLPIPSLSVPGNIPIEISLSGILAKFLTGPIIGSIFNDIASINLDLNFTSEIQGVLSSSGLNLDSQLLNWESPSTNTFSAKLTGTAIDASVSVTELDAIFGLGAALVLKLPFISPINLFTPFYEPLLRFGSSNSLMSLGHWYRLSVQSTYSQTSGSGWYISGTTATFSIADTTIPGPGGNYQFAGWTGTGLGGYNGAQQSHSMTARGPINETADWTLVSNASPASFLAPMAWALGIVLVAVLVAVVAVVVVLARRPKHSNIAG